MFNANASTIERPLRDNEVVETMGDRIRTLRQARGLTQERLGRLCGVSKVAVSLWESGATKNLKLQPFLAACEALGTDPHFLIFGPSRGAANSSKSNRG